METSTLELERITQGEKEPWEHRVLDMLTTMERLSDICVEGRLVIGGTLFMHSDIHKTTWRSPDQRTVSQIDHVIINQKWRRSLQDVKANRGADIGSDHVLVVATVSLNYERQNEEKKDNSDLTQQS